MKLPAKFPVPILLAMLAAPLSRSETVAYKFEVAATTVSPVSDLSKDFPNPPFLNGEFAYDDAGAVGQPDIYGVTTYDPLVYGDLNWTGPDGTSYNYSFYSNSASGDAGAVQVTETSGSSGVTIIVSNIVNGFGDTMEFMFANNEADVLGSNALPTSIDPNNFPDGDLGDGPGFSLDVSNKFYISGQIFTDLTSVAPPPGFTANAPEPSSFVLMWGGVLAAGIVWHVRRFTAPGRRASAGLPIRD